MDQLWYYEDHGRAKGPIGTRELVNKIQKGEMTLMDLVFKEGQPQWLPAESFSEITELIGNISMQESADWIVLKTVNVDGKNIHEQIGPFNAQQILDLLDKGKIRFNDYVWRTGYEKWVPLGRVDEFEKPLKSSVEVDRSLYTKPRHFDLLQNDKKEAPLKKVKQVVVPVNTLADEPIPEEAKGEDLAAPKWKVQTVTHRTETVESKPKKEEVVVAAKTPPPPAAVVEPKVAVQKVADATPIAKPVENKAAPQEKKKPARREVAALPPLPQSQQKEPEKKDAEFPEQKFPIFDDESLVAEPKSKRMEKEPASLRAAVNLETLPTETQKAKSFVEKIKKEEKVDSPEVAAQKEAANRRWMQAGAAACVVVIVFSASMFVLLGKKKARTSAANDFSIKIDPPPASAVKNTYKPKPAPQPVEASVETAPVAAETVQKKPQSKVATKPVQKTEPQTEKKESYDSSPTVSGSVKSRSYYHHKERIYLFYTSNEGEQLASDLQKASKTHQKSSKQWKTFYGGWKGKAKNYSLKVNKEAKKARLHRALFKQLMLSASDLEDLGRDVNSQITEGRSLSKVASAKNLESQFKNIGSNARNLDK